jgi:hypothetical protein
MKLSDDQVLKVFGELPDHRGTSSEELDAVERQFGVTLPAQYRTMMQLDAGRLTGAKIVLPLGSLQEHREDANQILVEDGHSFRLAATDFVFAWDDIFAFYFFTAKGKSDRPVMRFNYYLSSDNWEPAVAYNSLTKYFADAIGNT